MIQKNHNAKKLTEREINEFEQAKEVGNVDILRTSWLKGENDGKDRLINRTDLYKLGDFFVIKVKQIEKCEKIQYTYSTNFYRTTNGDIAMSFFEGVDWWDTENYGANFFKGE